eukprot:jgi/Botrbrau1/20269/Bobra.31_1s0053.2
MALSKSTEGDADDESDEDFHGSEPSSYTSDGRSDAEGSLSADCRSSTTSERTVSVAEASQAISDAGTVKAGLRDNGDEQLDEGLDEDEDDVSDSLSDSCSSSSISDGESESFNDQEHVQAGGCESIPAPAECCPNVVVVTSIPAAGTVSPGGAGSKEKRASGLQAGSALVGIDGGICHRTRARCPLEDVTLEQLEAYGLPDEDLLPLSDDDYYKEFLEAVKVGGGVELPEDDDDDDFVLDWGELLAHFGEEPTLDAADESTVPEKLPEPRGPRTRGRKSGAYIYQPKWQRWNFRERPLESTVRLQTRQLRKLLPAPPPDGARLLSPPDGNRPPQQQYGRLHGAGMPDAHALACMAGNEGLHQLLRPSEEGPQCLQAARGVAGGAMPAVNGGPALGIGCLAMGSGAKLGTAAAPNASWVDPTCVAAIMVSGIPTCVPVGMLLWTAEQRGILAHQIARHTQLLIQAYCMTARDPRFKEVASVMNNLLFQLQVVRQQLQGQLQGQVDGYRHTLLDIPLLDNLPSLFDTLATVPMVSEQDIVATEAARAEARKKRRNSRKPGAYLPVGPLPVMPTPVEDALRRLHPWLLPELLVENLPKPQRTNNCTTWWHSEDELLVQGIKRFAKNAALIHFYYLPAKDEKSILARIKTRSSIRAGQNSIKEVRKMSVGPLTPEEVKIIEDWLAANGENARHRWELISAQHMPQRHPHLLGKLYKDYKDGRPPNNNNYRPKDGTVRAVLMTTGEVAQPVSYPPGNFTSPPGFSVTPSLLASPQSISGTRQIVARRTSDGTAEENAAYLQLESPGWDDSGPSPLNFGSVFHLQGADDPETRTGSAYCKEGLSYTNLLFQASPTAPGQVQADPVDTVGTRHHIPKQPLRSGCSPRGQDSATCTDPDQDGPAVAVAEVLCSMGRTRTASGDGFSPGVSHGLLDAQMGNLDQRAPPASAQRTSPPGQGSARKRGRPQSAADHAKGTLGSAAPEEETRRRLPKRPRSGAHGTDPTSENQAHPLHSAGRAEMSTLMPGSERPRSAFRAFNEMVCQPTQGPEHRAGPQIAGTAQARGVGQVGGVRGSCHGQGLGVATRSHPSTPLPTKVIDGKTFVTITMPGAEESSDEEEDERGGHIVAPHLGNARTPDAGTSGGDHHTAVTPHRTRSAAAGRQQRNFTGKGAAPKQGGRRDKQSDRTAKTRATVAPQRSTRNQRKARSLETTSPGKALRQQSHSHRAGQLSSSQTASQPAHGDIAGAAAPKKTKQPQPEVAQKSPLQTRVIAGKVFVRRYMPDAADSSDSDREAPERDVLRQGLHEAPLPAGPRRNNGLVNAAGQKGCAAGMVASPFTRADGQHNHAEATEAGAFEPSPNRFQGGVQAIAHQSLASSTAPAFVGPTHVEPRLSREGMLHSRRPTCEHSDPALLRVREPQGIVHPAHKISHMSCVSDEHPQHPPSLGDGGQVLATCTSLRGQSSTAAGNVEVGRGQYGAQPQSFAVRTDSGAAYIASTASEVDPASHALSRKVSHQLSQKFLGQRFTGEARDCPPCNGFAFHV